MEEKQQINGISSYTSLEQQHAESIMRSVSMDQDDSKPLSESIDLYVKVESPEKHVEGYVSYCVTTQVRYIIIIDVHTSCFHFYPKVVRTRGFLCCLTQINLLKSMGDEEQLKNHTRVFDIHLSVGKFAFFHPLFFLEKKLQTLIFLLYFSNLLQKEKNSPNNVFFFKNFEP